MEIEQMGSIPPKANPFSYDLYHMGTRLGTNLMVMHANHPSEICNYLILCNTDTGERWRVAITPAGAKRTISEQIMTPVLIASEQAREGCWNSDIKRCNICQFSGDCADEVK
jgi:hypothetical protein